MKRVVTSYIGYTIVVHPMGFIVYDLNGMEAARASSMVGARSIVRRLRREAREKENK